MKNRSKFQHVYCDEPQHDGSWVDFPKPYTSGEGGYAAASRKYFAVAKKGPGGPVVVRSLDKPQRLQMGVPVLNVQKGKCSALQFSPFDPNLLVTGSEDMTIALTKVPENPEEMKDNISEAYITLNHHKKKITQVDCNPNVNGCLVSASYDGVVAVWDYTTESVLHEYTAASQVMDVKWNSNGSLLYMFEKKKRCKVFDPRCPEAETAMEFDSFAMAKSAHAFDLPNLGMIGGVGFGQRSKREVKIWDLRNPEKPVTNWQKEASGSVLMPWYDEDNDLLYLYGKGDGSVEWLKVDKKKIKSIGIYRNTEPQKGGCWVPKTGLDVMGCETARFMKLTETKVIPLKFIVPRKDHSFQTDIFPETYAGQPNLTLEQWTNGENADIIKCSLDPALGQVGGKVVELTKKKTYKELEAENEQLKARVAELEQQLGVNAEA